VVLVEKSYGSIWNALIGNASVAKKHAHKVIKIY
jgi:hypothetical protein